MEQQICVGETLNVSTVGAQRESWLKILKDANSGIRLQVDELTSIDTPGLQLLVAVRRQAEKQGKSFSISGLSDLLQDKSRLLGLESIMGGDC